MKFLTTNFVPLLRLEKAITMYRLLIWLNDSKQSVKGRKNRAYSAPQSERCRFLDRDRRQGGEARPNHLPAEFGKNP